MHLSRLTISVALAATLTASGVHAAPPVPGLKADEPSRAILLQDCPIKQSGATKSFLFGLLGDAVKYLFVKAADAITSAAKKENAKLNKVVTYEGFSQFYGDAKSGKPSKPTRCLVLVRFGDKTPTDAALTKALATFAVTPEGPAVLERLGFGKGASLRTPAFYAQFRLDPFLGTAGIERGQIGFNISPDYVFFGNSAAEKWGKQAKKTVRVELELKRLTETGLLADKPYYSAAFDLGELEAGQTRIDYGGLVGAPSFYPAPKELKAQVAFNQNGDPLAAPPVDIVPTAVTAKVIEAQDPTFLMQLLEKLSASQEDRIKKAAEAAAAAVVAGMKE